MCCTLSFVKEVPSIASPTCRQRVIIDDFFPTISEIAGLQEQMNDAVDGVSFSIYCVMSLRRHEKSVLCFGIFPIIGVRKARV